MNSKEFFKNLTQQFNSKLPFVAYRKSNTNEVFAMLQKDDLIHKVS